MTGQDMLDAVLRLLRIVVPGGTGTAEQHVEVLEALNMLLADWANDSIFIYSSVKETHTLTADLANYSIGDGADIDTERPVRIQGAFIRSGSTDYPLKIINEAAYRSLSLKATSGIPTQLFYQPESPDGIIYLYPTPGSAYSLHFWSLKALTFISSKGDDLTLPREYRRCVKYNLAIDYAPEAGAIVRPDVAYTARATLKRIKSLNAAMQVNPVKLETPFSHLNGQFIFEEG
jgi:hypothetical protein